MRVSGELSCYSLYSLVEQIQSKARLTAHSIEGELARLLSERLNGSLNTSRRLIRALYGFACREGLMMKTLILLMLLMQAQGQGTSPCQATDSKSKKDVMAAFSLEEICRIEGRMSLLRDGMSWEDASKKLGIWRKKKIQVIAHGGITYRHLGSGYKLAVPFSSEGKLKRLLLLDKEGKIVKDVKWQ
jgi:hypothetical protein